MPRYFFHVHDGKILKDETGIELLGLEEARREARRLAIDLLEVNPDLFWSGKTWKIVVASPIEATLFNVSFKATLEIEVASGDGG